MQYMDASTMSKMANVQYADVGQVNVGGVP